MDDRHKTKAELIDEVQQLRQRVAELEAVRGAAPDGVPAIDVLAKYQLLAAVARDVLLFVRARDGRILEANRAAEETYGCTRDELLGLTIYDLRAPSTRSGVATQMAQADLQGVTFETLHRRRDGREFPVEVNSGGITLGSERILLSIVRDITERKRAEEAIQSLARFPAENPSPILRIDRAGRLQYANEASHRFLSEWTLSVEQSAPAALQAMAATALAEQTIKVIDLAHGQRVLSFVVVPLMEAGYANLYGYDITTRQHMEAALRQSEVFFSKSFFNAPVALSLARLADGRILEVNDRFLNLFEYHRENLIGYTSLELDMYPEPSERAVLLGRMRQEGVIRDHEMTIRTHSGALRQVLISSVAVKLNDEDCILTTLLDMTERKQWESQREATLAALRQSEERFSKAFYHSPVALCLTRTADGRLFEVNDRFVDLIGYDRADIIGRTTLDLELYPDPKERAMLVAQLRQQGVVREHELTVRTRSGALRQTLLSSVLVKLNEEDSILAMLIDITERKQMETTLQELNATLEKRVQARTAELQIATNRLLELDRLKDEFVSRISHELRTPLANAQLYIELLKSGKTESREQYLQTLRHEIQRLRILIEDLLKIVQLTSDLIEPDPRETDLNQLILAHEPAWRERVAQRGLEFKIDLAADLPLTFIDQELIAQVIAQLLQNATAYTAQGTISLVTAGGQRDRREWVTVSVSDTGPGIAPDELPHIFERFYRGRAAANYKTPGTGVGLSISRDIVSLLKGQITVQSEVNHGSNFVIWLPADSTQQVSFAGSR